MKHVHGPRFVLTLALSSILAVGCQSTDPGPDPADGGESVGTEIPSALEDEVARDVWTGALDQAAFAALHELTDAQAPPALGHEVDLGDGSTLYVSPALDDDAPGLIVIHEWWGRNDHIRHCTDRFAAAGYHAVAVDLYGGAVASTRDEAMAAMSAVDPAAAAATLRHAADYLEAELGVQRYGSIGWCFGGGWSLQTAIDQADLDACVIFYGRLSTDPEALAKIHAPILGVFGTRDRSIPTEAVNAFEAAALVHSSAPSLQINHYDAEHAFANPSSARYDASSAEAAWNAVQEFLADKLRTDDAPSD